MDGLPVSCLSSDVLRQAVVKLGSSVQKTPSRLHRRKNPTGYYCITRQTYYLEGSSLFENFLRLSLPGTNLKVFTLNSPLSLLLHYDEKYKPNIALGRAGKGMAASPNAVVDA